MESIHSFLDAVGTFIDHLSDVRWNALLIAMLFHCANLVLRSRAWCSIVRAAFPRDRVRFRTVLGAYLAGVGINAFAPARGGDVVKIATVRQRVEGSNVPALTSSLVAETVFDFFIATALLSWAYATSRLPRLPDIPDRPAFELSFIARHERGTLIVLGAAVIGVWLLLRWLGHHVRAFWLRVEQGVVILRTPRRYLRCVASLQAVGWSCRVASAYFLLEAFGVHASVTNALLVLVVGSVATMLPITPGGAGAQQALLVIVLAGQASSSSLIAYSVGAQVATTVVNATLGAVSLFLLFGSVRFRHIRAEHASGT
jgi:uncharacterized membrane protein YbhN (UPF0104 family)